MLKSLQWIPWDVETSLWPFRQKGKNKISLPSFSRDVFPFSQRRWLLWGFQSPRCALLPSLLCRLHASQQFTMSVFLSIRWSTCPSGEYFLFLLFFMLAATLNYPYPITFNWCCLVVFFFWSPTSMSTPLISLKGWRQEVLLASIQYLLLAWSNESLCRSGEESVVHIMKKLNR